MANTKTITGSTSSTGWTYKLEVTEAILTDDNKKNNTSNVNVKAYIGRSSSSSYMYGCRVEGSITVDGNIQYYSWWEDGRVDVSDWLQVGSLDFTVTHNTDGTKTANISSSFTNNVHPDSGSASGSITLTAIPRGVTINTVTPSPLTLGGDLTVTIVKNNNPTNVQVSLYNATGVTPFADYRAMSGTSYTFKFTDAEKATMLKLMPSNGELAGAVYVQCNLADGSIFRDYRFITIKKGGEIRNIKISSAPTSINLGDNLAVTIDNTYNIPKISIAVQNSGNTTAYATSRDISGKTSYTFTFTDAELDAMYKAMGTTNSLSASIYVKAGDTTSTETITTSKAITIKLTGNQKTGHINVNGSWKRTKRWINVNGTWRRCVRWINVNGTWHRCI